MTLAAPLDPAARDAPDAAPAPDRRAESRNGDGVGDGAADDGIADETNDGPTAESPTDRESVES